MINATITLLLLLINSIVFYKIISKTHNRQFQWFYVGLLLIHSIAFWYSYGDHVGDLHCDFYQFYSKVKISKSITDFFGYGHRIMSLIIYPLVKLKFSYFNIALLFTTLSLQGFYMYYNLIITSKASLQLKCLFLSLMLLPSLHYWTTSLSKEAILLFILAVVLVQIRQQKYFSVPIILSVIISFAIRPYIGVIIIVSVVAHQLFDKTLHVKTKKMLSVLLLALIVIVIPLLLKFLKIDTISIEAIQKTFQKVIVYSQTHGNSSINLVESNYFERLILVLIRPLFFDAQTVSQIIVSLENLLILGCLIKVIYNFSYKKYISSYIRSNVYIIFVVLGVVCFLSIYMYNLGLASRMRVMFIPYLFIFLFEQSKSLDDGSILYNKITD